MPDLFDAPTLGIDLGASFAKIAYRPAWPVGGRTTFEKNCQIVLIEGKALVPSLVLQTGDERRPWICGQDAADFTPGQGGVFHANWKERMFNDAFNAKVGIAFFVAIEFFRWLRSEIRQAGIEPEKCQVKLCLPAFPDITEPASRFGQAMELAGWQNPIITPAFEPHANALGIYGEGRNALFINDHGCPDMLWKTVYPPNSEMLDFLRKSVLFDGPRNSTVAIIDLGAYTTDFSIVELDAGANGDCIGDPKQWSETIGMIAGFERPLFAEIGARYNFTLESLSFTKCELFKQEFNNGQPFNLLIAGRDQSLGGEEDQTMAKNLADQFAERVWTAYRKIIGNTKVSYRILTGGGSASKLIEQAIKARFPTEIGGWMPVQGMEVPQHQRIKSRTFPEVPGPRRPLGRRRVTTAEALLAELLGTPVVDAPVVSRDRITYSEPATGPLRCWPDAGEKLERLATALGAASTMLDLPKGPAAPEWVPLPPSGYPYVACICGGRHPQCVHCNGRGERLPR